MKKKLLSILSLALVLSMLITGAAVSTTATSDDPSDSYEKQTAAAEDSTLDMWFNHSFVKTARGDNVSTGKDTYSIYLAKNETESAQVVLSSLTGHKGLTVSLTDFTDGKGNTISSEVYREFYVTLEGVNENNVLGGGVVRSDIDQPEVIMPASDQGAFDIDAGMTQAFLLRANSTSDTPSGWYSAQFTVRQHPVNGGVIDLSTYVEVKTATVYAYVWDFEMPESSSFQTAVSISSAANATTSTNYKTYYDYLLDNRICGFQVPGTLSGDNEYVHDPRVSAFCVTLANAYPSNSKLTSSQIANLYADFSSQEDWDVIKEKAYFYFDDEPMSLAQQEAVAQAKGSTTVTGRTVDSVKSSYATIASAWLEDPYIAVPFHENHPYPYDNTYGTTFMRDLYAQGADIKDATQEMMDSGTVTLWVPKNNAFTPMSELKAIGYAGTGNDLIRNLDCSISGLIYKVANPNTTGVTDRYLFVGEGYFDWSQKYGEFSDRISTYLTEANAAGKSTKMWWYLAGRAGGYTYANHLIENSGLQTKMYFWQSYQVGATGYLYYGSDNWTENGTAKTTMTETYYDVKTGEAKTSSINYFMNRLYQNNGYVYGNGVLYYDNKVATPLYRVANGVTQNTRVAGTIRVDIMRDGIEDYEMLKMYESLCGEDAAQAIVSKISDNVVRYASLAGFDLTAHGWDAGMTADDAVAAARVELGNAVEKAVKATAPDKPETEAPETQAPETEAPETEAPETEAPETEAPETEAPETEAPETEAPATEAPETQAPETEAPETETPATEAPETQPQQPSEPDAEDITVYVTGETQGDTLTLTASLSNNPGLGCFGLSMSYDPDVVKLISATPSSEVFPSGLFVMSNIGEDPTIPFYVLASDETIDAEGNAINFYYDDGVLMTYTFQILDPDGDPAISFAPMEGWWLSDPNWDTEYTPDIVLNIDFGGSDTDTTAPQIVIGDINGDGKINATDALIIKRYIAGNVTLTDAQKSAADINGDGRINATDSLLIKRYIAGLSTNG